MLELMNYPLPDRASRFATRPTVRPLFSLAVASLAMLGVLSASVSAAPPGLEHIDQGWIDSWEFEIDRQLTLMESAYNLDADALATLRQEMQNRLLLQWEHDQESDREMADLLKQLEESGMPADDENSPLVQQLNDRLMSQTNSMPLNDLQVAGWLEERLPPPVAAQGRARFEELRQRHLLRMSTQEHDAEVRSSLKSTLTREAVSMTAEVPAMYGRPVPSADIVEVAEARDRLERMKPYVEPMSPKRSSEREAGHDGVPQYAPPPIPQPDPVRAQQPAAQPQQTAQQPKPISPPRPTVTPEQPPATKQPQQAQPVPPPPPAPPLDEWEKYVLTVAAKYEFDESQATNARSILSDLRRRAYQYRASRAEDFARVELMTDAKARTEELKNLNRPQDAMFEELKQRLESLPTIAQRQKAGTAPTGRK